MVYKKIAIKDETDNNTSNNVRESNNIHHIQTLLFDFQNTKNRYYKFIPHVGL